MKTGAVIVLYNPEMFAVKASVDLLLQQVDLLCIVDNSSFSHQAYFLSDKISFFHYPNNIGIASAQNVGIKHLLANQFCYCLLLDQDSRINNQFVSTLKYELIKLNQQGYKIAAIGPKVYCFFSGNEVNPIVQRKLNSIGQADFVSQIISSGMLIKLSMINKIGLKDESLFIDGVDHEWCWRAVKLGMSIGIANNVKMIHTLGDSRNTFMFIEYKVGAPIRLYYQFRNIIVLTRRDYVPTYWKVRNLCFLPFRLFTNSCLEKSRALRIKYMIHGLWDGIKGKTGPYNRHH